MPNCNIRKRRGRVTNPEHLRRLERMYLAAPINAYYEPEITIGTGTATIRMKVKPEWFHAANAVHGSVYFKALDDSGFFAANSLVEAFFVLTSNYSITMVRPLSSGEMTATGIVVHHGKRLLSAESKLVDDNDRVIAHGIGTFMVSNMPLAEVTAYR